MKRTVRLISWACGSLFTVFAVLYLFMMQSDLLTTAQHLLSKGQTAYSPIWGTAIIVLILLLLQKLFRKVLVYPLRFHALYYFPSSLALGLITAFTARTGWDVDWSISWLRLLVYIFLYFTVTWVALHFPDTKSRKHDTITYLWTNFLLLSLQFCMVGSLGNTNDVYHYRLRVEKYMAAHQDTLALQVGFKSLQADRNLTAMRMFALSRCGQMGEKLFEYPQYYGSDGLIPNRTDTIDTYGWTNELHKHLGGKPGKGIKSTTRFLELLTHLPSATPAAKDYLLCAYLLDKDLERFVDTLPEYYTVNDSLPLCYKEAVVLYNRLHTHPAIIYKNEAIETNLNDFMQLGNSYNDPTERSNQCRRMYGNTYWWYYYYQSLLPENSRHK